MAGTKVALGGGEKTISIDVGCITSDGSNSDNGGPSDTLSQPMRHQRDMFLVRKCSNLGPMSR